MIDRKLEPLIRRQMVNYLGELEDDDLVMFVVEHLKDHKGPQKLIEGLEPVRLTYNWCTCHFLNIYGQVLEEEAQEFTISIWRQIIFESMAYGEGLHTERLMVS
jgi:RNA-binding protein 25